MLNKKFTVNKMVCFGDTNLEGNVYFVNFFKWQGEVRELFLKEICPNFVDKFNKGLRLYTANASVEYLDEARIYDEIEISLQLFSPKMASVKEYFEFRNVKTNKLIATGEQKIVFANADKKVVRIPADILLKSAPYLKIK